MFLQRLKKIDLRALACSWLFVIALFVASSSAYGQSDAIEKSAYGSLLQLFQQHEHAQVIATVEQLTIQSPPSVSDLQSVYLGAESYYAIGNYDRSRKYFEFWIANCTKQSMLERLKPYCKLRLAQIHAKLNDPPAAIAVLNELLSENVDANVQNSACLQKAWLLAEANPNSTEAMALCERCIEAYPAGSHDYLSTLLLKSVLLQQQGNFKDASALLMEIRAASDESKSMQELRYKASLLLLQVNQSLGDSSLNSSLVNELQQATPPSQRLLELGKLEVLMATPDSQLDDADLMELELLGLKAKDPQARQRALLRLVRLPDTQCDEAVRSKCCKELLEMKQLDSSIRSEVTVRYAKSLHAQGDATEAVDLLLNITKSIELNDPWRPATMILLAETSYLDERFDVSKDTYQKVLDSGLSESAQVRFLATMRLGEIAAISNDWTLADQFATDLKQSTDLFGYDASANYLFGRLAVAKGEIDQARDYLKLAVEAASIKEDEVAARAQWLIGETYMLQSQFENAIAGYQAVLKYGQQSQWCALSHLQAAKCYEQLGRWEDVITCYETLLTKYPESIHTEEAKNRLAAAKQTLTPRMAESTTNAAR